MRKTLRLVCCFAVLVLAVSWPIRCVAGPDPFERLARTIASRSHGDSTVVLVVLDQALRDELRMRLPPPIGVLLLSVPDVAPHEAPRPEQLGRLFRDASAATVDFTDVWVLWSASAPVRVARFAEMVARPSRRRTLRDSTKTPSGTVTFSRWVDLPGGVAQRTETRRALAMADSILARGVPKPTPITRPFTRSELAVDPDTLARYVGRLADTSFYSIGGCSEVELVMWTASETLGRLGPGVVPVLVARISDPDPFVRERVQEALLYVTQDERILARTDGDYLKFYDQPERAPRELAREWWARFSHFWTEADTLR